MDANEKINVLSRNLSYLLSSVNDVDFEDTALSFVTKGGWKDNMTLKDAITSCIQFAAIKKAFNK